DLCDQDIPHRSQMLELILKTYRKERQKLLDEMKSAIGRVSFTTDLWSDINWNSYMAVTAHWITK
ncbi:hypothetical protein K474DRAFT_1581770, partial [Panus rudis PR-1116 ss-1]